MDNRDQQNPSAGQENDLSKAQNQQQPQAGAQSQQSEGQAQQQQPSSNADLGNADRGRAGQSDTLTEQRSDIEGGTSTGQASDGEGVGGSSFVGSQGGSDTSGELIEDDNSTDFAKDGQGASE